MEGGVLTRLLLYRGWSALGGRCWQLQEAAFPMAASAVHGAQAAALLLGERVIAGSARWGRCPEAGKAWWPEALTPSQSHTAPARPLTWRPGVVQSCHIPPLTGEDDTDPAPAVQHIIAVRCRIPLSDAP